ncbi:MAG: hypothetical protein ACYDAY_08290 [Candidatus Dormibacteria bacterium]
MRNGIRNRYLLAAAATFLAVAAQAGTAQAATSGTSTTNLVLGAGVLSISGIGTGTINATVGNASASASLGAATWQDATGSGSGWNGTISLTQFNYNGGWVANGGSANLGVNTSPNYTGSGSGYYTVTVTSYSTVTGALTYSWAGLETATTGSTTLPASGNTATAVGTQGVTITWGPRATNYAAGSYTIKVGQLATTALALNDGSGSISANSGTTSVNPTFTNNTATVTAGGSAVKFVTAALLTGMGAYTVTPDATVSYDPSVWAATYTATATYTIATGP